jgi:ADYC domain
VLGPLITWKVARAGYKPWQTAPDGRPMWDYHQACTRMMRADYCGDGKAHTREGTPIEILSRLDPAEEPHGGLVFEAGWTPEGASCVAKARLSPSWPLEAIAAECPERLRGRVGDAATCTAATELARPEVLLVNKSETSNYRWNLARTAALRY